MTRLDQIEENLERVETYAEYMHILEILAREEIKQHCSIYAVSNDDFMHISKERYVYQTSDDLIDDGVSGCDWINTFNPKLWEVAYYGKFKD